MSAISRLLSVRWLHQGVNRYGVARIRLPDGSAIEREIEDHGSAVGVLPYDPVRRVALLVEQPRVGLLVAGEPAILLECPAGRLEADDPEDEARREVREETGAALHDLEFIVDAWPIASVSSERVRLYLARYEAADRVEDGGGLEEENEAIHVRELPLANLAAQALNGRLTDMKTMLLVLALQLRHPELFRGSS